MFCSAVLSFVVVVVVFLTFSLFWIINCGWCVRHGLDYLVVCSLCKSAAAIKINFCLFIFSLDVFPTRSVSQRVR